MSEIARRLQLQRRSWAHPGSSHDRVVLYARRSLPFGIAVLGILMLMAPLTLHGDVSFVLDKNKVDVASERLRIEAAEYRGEDSKGRPFSLHAGSAVQRSSAEPIVELNDLAAQIQLSDGPASLAAPRGRYDMDKEQVAIDGPVRFQSQDGYALNTADATVNLRDRTMESTGAVNGSTPMGSFSGDHMTADLESRTVTLEGNARLRIVPGQANRR